MNVSIGALGAGPDLVHGPAAIDQHAHRLCVLEGLLQIPQLLFTWRQTIILVMKNSDEFSIILEPITNKEIVLYYITILLPKNEGSCFYYIPVPESLEGLA